MIDRGCRGSRVVNVHTCLGPVAHRPGVADRPGRSTIGDNSPTATTARPATARPAERTRGVAMVGLVGSALRARRGQTVAVFVLTLLAALGASAAPWFLAWARAGVAAS